MANDQNAQTKSTSTLPVSEPVGHPDERLAHLAETIDYLSACHDAVVEPTRHSWVNHDEYNDECRMEKEAAEAANAVQGSNASASSEREAEFYARDAAPQDILKLFNGEGFDESQRLVINEIRTLLPGITQDILEAKMEGADAKLARRVWAQAKRLKEKVGEASWGDD